jgi:hypothetical protein
MNAHYEVVDDERQLGDITKSPRWTRKAEALGYARLCASDEGSKVELWKWLDGKYFMQGVVEPSDRYGSKYSKV